MQAFNRFTTLWLSCSLALLAGEGSLQTKNYLSTTKQKTYELEYEKNEASYSILRDSWIAPLQLNYSYTKTNPYSDVQTNQSASLRLRQPIFQSGGIYFGIKYAQALKKYSDYSVKVAEYKAMGSILSLLMQIEQTSLKIEKQKLLILNAEINLEQKKEQYLSGQLDASYLDSAIIDKNLAEQMLYDLESAKERLVSSFIIMSDKEYKTLPLPHFERLTKDDFLKHNFVMKQKDAQIKMESENHNVTITKYLPSVNLVGGYNWTKNENPAMLLGDTERDYYDYGIAVNMPLSINSLKDVESSKIEYLKAKLSAQDKVLEVGLLYDQVMQNVKNLDKKRNLSHQNITLREKLFEDTKRLFEAGYKTQYDVDLLKNSLEIEKLNLSIYSIETDITLLPLYEIYER